jgi:hypothetical protein
MIKQDNHQQRSISTGQSIHKLRSTDDRGSQAPFKHPKERLNYPRSRRKCASLRSYDSIGETSNTILAFSGEETGDEGGGIDRIEDRARLVQDVVVIWGSRC